MLEPPKAAHALLAHQPRKFLDAVAFLSLRFQLLSPAVLWFLPSIYCYNHGQCGERGVCVVLWFLPSIYCYNHGQCGERGVCVHMRDVRNGICSCVWCGLPPKKVTGCCGCHWLYENL